MVGRTADDGFRFYRMVRRCFLLLARPLFRFRVEGARHIPPAGAAVLVCAHHSWLDPPCLGAACPRPVRFLVLDTVYERFGIRAFYRRMRSIPVSPRSKTSARALRTALRHLSAGGLVGVFPHGRVVPRGGQPTVHRGAALLAVLGRAPVIPVRIDGSDRAWPHGRAWPGPAAVRVRFAPAIPAPAGRGAAEREALQRRIAEAIST